MHILQDFKGFKLADINLLKPLTVLIGPNGSGKSNAIEGIELLSFLARGRPIHEITDLSKGGSIEVRGGLQSCPRRGSDTFSLGFVASTRFEGKWRSIFYFLGVTTLPRPRITFENLSLDDDKTLIFKTTNSDDGGVSADIRVQYNNFARGGHKPQVSVSANRSVLSQYRDFAQNNRKREACFELVDDLMRYLRASFVFDPRPNLMREYERIGNTVLLRDGSNLSAVLYGLGQGTPEERESLARLLGWIKQLPEEPFQDIGFVTTELNDVIFGFKENADAPLIDARLLSDGTLRCLAVLTALETADTGSRVIIEEFDNGLHPSRVHILTRAISECCKRRHLNVLVTTHNPATLNALDEDMLDGVVVCAWDQSEGTFKLIPLLELPRHDELLERARLGDLVTRNVVEQYLTPHFEENRKEEALNWLKNLP
ncbi:MAG: ATP-binding protein [Proteobacteria bacterium]|nr:ATP-binding protein [Pseudomonadota bacterium]